VEFSVAAAHFRLGRDRALVLCGVSFDPVADEGGDLADVEGGQQDGGDDLGCGEPADSSP
jgi:hypothetical protein